MKTLLLLVAATLMCAPARGEPPLRIVTIFPKTGNLSMGTTAVDQEPGAQFGVDEINGAGGLVRRQLELIQLDSKSTPLGAIAP